MNTTIKNSGNQSTLFWVLFYLMLFFFCVDLATDFLLVTHYTERQVGADLAKDAYKGLFLIMLTVARAEGEKLVSSLKGGGGTATETTTVEVQQVPEEAPKS